MTRIATPHTTTLVVDDGTPIAVHRWSAAPGAPAAPPVVLHHGFVVHAKLEWLERGMVGKLIAAGRDVVAVDARGHGESGTSPDPARYGEARMAQDLRAVLASMDVPAADLVGYSMGAIVSLLTTAREPLIRRLVVGGVGAGVVELGGVDTRALPADELRAAFLADDPARLPPGPAADMRAFAQSIGADLPSLAAHAQAVHTARIELAAITAPTLVIAGDADPLAVRPEVLAAAIPDAQVQLVSGDHQSTGTRPEFFAAILQFLHGETR